MNYLNLHSLFSPMRGLYSPRDLCDKAKENNATHVALTDINGLYGLLNFLECAQEYNIEPIIGAELKDKGKNCVVLVKNKKGYQQLCQHLSHYYLDQVEMFDMKSTLFSSDDLVFITHDKKLCLQLESQNIFFSLTPGQFKHSDVLWAREKKIDVIANNMVFYLAPEDQEIFELLRSIDKNTTLDQYRQQKKYNSYCRMMSEEEMNRYFSLYPESLINLEKLSISLDARWYSKKVITPGYNNLSERACNKLLKRKCQKMIKKRYKNESDAFLKEVEKRLNQECQIISQKKFSSYFLNVEDITKQCEFTCGRGSSAASIVNFLLGITHVEPLRENLLFERFMNLEREDPPDIDVDFPSDQRDDILDYIFSKFGERAAMVANHNYLRGRSAIREVAKVYGIKDDEIKFITERLESIELNSLWQKVLTLAARIEGCLRNLSVHCGGVVITPGPIANYVPIQRSAKGYPVIQWEKDQAEASGLIKTDILGNKGLSVIRDVIQSLNKDGMAIDYSKLNPLKDKKTSEIFKAGDTIGVMHFESPRCRTLLKTFKDDSLQVLSIVCSIIRPAAMGQVNEILRRFKGEAFDYHHPDLEDVLKDSYGVMIYQEDVIRVVTLLAGFSAQEGNELRKILAKKHKSLKLDFFFHKFTRGCYKKGLSEQSINDLWNDILSFSGYSFCKAHSDSYSLVAYKSAYLKAHYPAEFMASVITQGGGFYVGNVEHYLNEARRLGVIILPPDVNLSSCDYVGRKREIRVGLKQVKFLKRKTLSLILAERACGEFKSIKDFLKRVDISFEQARVLVKARCFNSLRGKGSTKLTHIQLMSEVYQYFLLKDQKNKNDAKFQLCKQVGAEYSFERLLSWEYKYLDGFVTFPSWFLYRDLLKKRHIIPAIQIFQYEKKEVILYGQIMTKKRVRTKYQEAMSFITFSDDTGAFNTTFFPRVYEQCRDLIFLGGSFLVKGTVERDLDDFQIIVDEITRVGVI